MYSQLHHFTSRNSHSNSILTIMLVLKSCIFIPSWTNRHKKHQKNSKLLGKKLRFKSSTQVFAQLLSPSVSNPTSHSQPPVFPNLEPVITLDTATSYCCAARKEAPWVLWCGAPQVSWDTLTGTNDWTFIPPTEIVGLNIQGSRDGRILKALFQRYVKNFYEGPGFEVFLPASNKRCTKHQVIFFEGICE